MLTLFFIDEVVKYRDYNAADEKGEYARIFEEEYLLYLDEVLALDETPYSQYLKGITADKTHRGYFSIDKKNKRLTDSTVAKRGENAGLSDDVDAYDLILNFLPNYLFCGIYLSLPSPQPLSHRERGFFGFKHWHRFPAKPWFGKRSFERQGAFAVAG